MKRVLTLVSITLLLAHTTWAQEGQSTNQNEIQTLSSGHKLESGFYGGITPGVAIIEGDAAMETGIRGGWIINHYFVLGLAGSSFFRYNTNLHQNPNLNNYRLFMGGYGGLLLEPIF